MAALTNLHELVRDNSLLLFFFSFKAGSQSKSHSYRSTLMGLVDATFTVCEATVPRATTAAAPVAAMKIQGDSGAL